jgi:superfamily I DNA/RNA helicase
MVAIEFVARDHRGAPIRLLAPPGSGKTAVLTERAIQMVGNRELEPEQFLALTFTTKAAREMQRRILTRSAAACKETTTRVYQRGQERNIGTTRIMQARGM